MASYREGADGRNGAVTAGAELPFTGPAQVTSVRGCTDLRLVYP